MTRARAHVREAELLQKRSDRALVIVDPETLGDDALEIDAPPAHDAVDFAVRAGLDELGELAQLLRRQARRRAARVPVVDQPVRPRALKRCTQSRSVWRSMPPILAASPRSMPSRTAASDNSRRLWLASFKRLASARSSSAE